MVKKIKLNLANIQVEFTDREQALKRMEEWAEEGMVNVQVIYGPEGCGKSAWLRQSVELLKELGFEVIYLNPIEKQVMMETGIEDVKKKMLSIIAEESGDPWIKAAWAIVDLARAIIAMGKDRLAVLVDDAFQAIGLDKAAVYVKGLLGLIEYPPRTYDVMITVAATSEGMSRREIGRHRWAYLIPMWNMSKEGFKQLYDQIQGEKPDFKRIWELTGGNPKLLGELYKAGWNEGKVLDVIVESRGLRNFIAMLSHEERAWLREAVEDPDALFTRERMRLLDKLVELNLVVNDVPYRKDYLWIDTPPPERDIEIGIGKYVAWQSPLHREAVRRVLEWVK